MNGQAKRGEITMKKINWKNVSLLIVLVICAIRVVKDVFMLTIVSFITGKLYTFTWFGAITFVTALIIGSVICVYIVEYINEKEKKFMN